MSELDSEKLYYPYRARIRDRKNDVILLAENIKMARIRALKLFDDNTISVSIYNNGILNTEFLTND